MLLGVTTKVSSNIFVYMSPTVFENLLRLAVPLIVKSEQKREIRMQTFAKN